MDQRTAEILRRFTQSCTETLNFYDELINYHPGFARLKSITQFIQRLQQHEGDRFFRLGTSMHDLIISRSVDHGLRKDQKFIKIEPYDFKFEVTLRDGEKVYRQYMVDSLKDEKVDKLLETLKHTLID